MKELAEALAAAAAPPCTAYSCPSRRDCASKKLACESFVYFVNTGRVVHPLMVFRGNKHGWKPANYLKAEYHPTHELFHRSMGIR